MNRTLQNYMFTNKEDPSERELAYQTMSKVELTEEYFCKKLTLGYINEKINPLNMVEYGKEFNSINLDLQLIKKVAKDKWNLDPENIKEFDGEIAGFYNVDKVNIVGYFSDINGNVIAKATSEKILQDIKGNIIGHLANCDIGRGFYSLSNKLIFASRDHSNKNLPANILIDNKMVGSFTKLKDDNISGIYKNFFPIKLLIHLNNLYEIDLNQMLQKFDNQKIIADFYSNKDINSLEKISILTELDKLLRLYPENLRLDFINHGSSIIDLHKMAKTIDNELNYYIYKTGYKEKAKDFLNNKLPIASKYKKIQNLRSELEKHPAKTIPPNLTLENTIDELKVFKSKMEQLPKELSDSIYHKLMDLTQKNILYDILYHELRERKISVYKKTFESNLPKEKIDQLLAKLSKISPSLKEIFLEKYSLNDIKIILDIPSEMSESCLLRAVKGHYKSEELTGILKKMNDYPMATKNELLTKYNLPKIQNLLDNSDKFAKEIGNPKFKKSLTLSMIETLGKFNEDSENKLFNPKEIQKRANDCKKRLSILKNTLVNKEKEHEELSNSLCACLITSKTAALKDTINEIETKIFYTRFDLNSFNSVLEITNKFQLSNNPPPLELRSVNKNHSLMNR